LLLISNSYQTVHGLLSHKKRFASARFRKNLHVTKF
jgi:hypothetical protein